MSFVSFRKSSNIFLNINSSLSPRYVNIHIVPQGFVLGPILFIIHIIPINLNFHKILIFTVIFMPMIFIFIYTLFPSSSDSDMIQMTMFNCITDLTEWFSHNLLSLQMTKTGTIIFSRPSHRLSTTHHFLLSLPTSKSISTLGFTIKNNAIYLGCPKYIAQSIIIQSSIISSRKCHVMKLVQRSIYLA